MPVSPQYFGGTGNKGFLTEVYHLFQSFAGGAALAKEEPAAAAPDFRDLTNSHSSESVLVPRVSHALSSRCLDSECRRSVWVPARCGLGLEHEPEQQGQPR